MSAVQTVTSTRRRLITAIAVLLAVLLAVAFTSATSGSRAVQGSLASGVTQVANENASTAAWVAPWGWSYRCFMCYWLRGGEIRA